MNVKKQAEVCLFNVLLFCRISILEIGELVAMETYDFSALAAGNFGSDMSGTGGFGSPMSGGTNSFGGGTGGFGSGMGGGTNSFGSGTGGFGSGMSSQDLESLFKESPWGGLSDVGINNFEQVFRGNTGGNLQRGGSSTSGSGNSNQGEGDTLLTGGEGNTSANSGYSYNFSSLP